MQVRWCATGAVLGFGLACAGGDPQPDPPSPTPRPTVPATPEPDGPAPAVPDLLGLFLPAAPAPAEVTVADGVHRARYDELALDAAVRGWSGPVGIVDRSSKRVVGASVVSDRVILAVVEDLEPGLIVSVHERVPALDLPAGGCSDGQIAVAVPWPGGATLSACLAVGAEATPIGPFRIERNDIVVVEGAWSATGLREGQWTSRDDNGRPVASGAYVGNVPVGIWTFTVEGVQREVPYVDGLPTDVPTAQLPSSRATPRRTVGTSFEILDADLAAGWIAASERWTPAEELPSATGAGRPVRDCPATGRLDPKGGWKLLLLRPGFRTPVGEWIVYDAPLDPAPCTTEEEAAAALLAANEAFASHGLDPLQRVTLLAPTGGTTPFSPGTDPVRFDIAGHSLSIRSSNRELALEEQLRVPDLLAGSWVGDARQVVRSASVFIDGQVVDDLWLRWPTGCPGGATVDGAIVEPADGGAMAAVVYRSVDVLGVPPTGDPASPVCVVAGSLWTVGGPIHLDPVGDHAAPDGPVELIE